MYLLDTNILLELLLDQARADTVEQFLQIQKGENLFLSDFSLYSICIILFKRNHLSKLMKFIEDFIHGGIRIQRIDLQDIPRIIEIAKKYRLDFDDAYQYAVAEKYNLTIVSFDHDFDQTERGRVDPDEISTPQDNEREP